MNFHVTSDKVTQVKRGGRAHNTMESPRLRQRHALRDQSGLLGLAVRYTRWYHEATHFFEPPARSGAMTSHRRPTIEGMIETAGHCLGLDGGGSSLRGVAINEVGETVKSMHGGPANVVVVGERKAREALREVVQDTRYDVIVAGMAGGDRPWVRRFWEDELRPFARHVTVVGDYRIAWAALTGGEPGMVAIFGTGSICYGEHQTLTARVGGYGWKVGDVGSGIALGSAAIRASVAAWERWGPPTSLEQAVRAWSGVEGTRELLDYLYRPAHDWRNVSDLAAHVFSNAESGDEAAETILRDASREILLQWQSVLHEIRLDRTAMVGLTGGLAPLWRQRLDPLWHDVGGEPLVSISREPVEGAAQWAVRLAHEEAP